MDLEPVMLIPHPDNKITENPSVSFVGRRVGIIQWWTRYRRFFHKAYICEWLSLGVRSASCSLKGSSCHPVISNKHTGYEPGWKQRGKRSSRRRSGSAWCSERDHVVGECADRQTFETVHVFSKKKKKKWACTSNTHIIFTWYSVFTVLFPLMMTYTENEHLQRWDRNEM